MPDPTNVPSALENAVSAYRAAQDAMTDAADEHERERQERERQAALQLPPLPPPEA